MTQWGLSAELRKEKPWGLEESLLAPGKVITDPIHGGIHLSKLEIRLLNSKPMQRLRRVRQLGTSHLVYPGATHTRLSHSLGALYVAQRIFDVVEAQRSGPHPTRDLFDEWIDDNDQELPYRRRLAEAIVLVRLGGLLHDLCHIPYGHTLEDDLGLLSPHDENESRFERLWSQIPDELRQPMESGGLRDALRPLILSKSDKFACGEYKSLPPFKERPPELRYPFVRDVVGNTICADLIDYLRRDHYMTGLPASLGDRFLDGFYVAPSGSWCAERMVMRIARGDRERADIVTELFKYLRYRYEETERILVHHTKLSADAMIGKLLAMWSDELLIEELGSAGVKLTPAQVRDVELLMGDQAKAEAIGVARQRVAARLENLFLERGDDGILEHIAHVYRTTANSRQDAIAALTNGVLDRDLYKMIGRASETRGMDRETFFAAFGGAGKKREIERRVAKFAELPEGWNLLLWIPHPGMRLKPADVLVTSDGRTILPLRNHRRHGPQGEAINSSHQDLWAVSLFAPAAVEDNKQLCSAILAEVSREMKGLEWQTRSDGFEDAEAAITAGVVAEYHLPTDSGAHMVNALRSGSAAALTRRLSVGSRPAAPSGERTYSNLRDQAVALAEAETASRTGPTVVDIEVDEGPSTSPSLFDPKPGDLSVGDDERRGK